MSKMHRTVPRYSRVTWATLKSRNGYRLEAGEDKLVGDHPVNRWFKFWEVPYGWWT